MYGKGYGVDAQGSLLIPINDLALGLSFLKEIQVHYDMNSKLKMFMEKLQMFTYSRVFSK
jgi:hypothetical protein